MVYDDTNVKVIINKSSKAMGGIKFTQDALYVPLDTKIKLFLSVLATLALFNSET